MYFILILRLKAIPAQCYTFSYLHYTNAKLLLYLQPALYVIFKKLCAIRDNTFPCDIADNDGLVTLITIL